VRDVLWLALFVVITLGGGLVIGNWARPGDWYARLKKPSFNPPNWVFAPVWSLLYFLIAIAGWRVFSRAPGGAAMGLWWVALALNFLWSPVFFRLHRPAAALVVVLALLAANVAFLVTAWPVDGVAALLFAPYIAWVAFASVLNAAVVRLN
jgi:tryptophan-rich sensory protein